MLLANKILSICIICLSSAVNATDVDKAIFRPEVRSWKTLRDAGINKQDRDFSCGAAALSTLLTYYFNQPISEQEIIKRIGKESSYSLADLKRVAEEYGFRTLALAAEIQALRNLKVPAILYIQQDRIGVSSGHFTVLRTIGDQTVSLADPSLGNWKLNTQRFQKLWETRDDKSLPGRMLILLPPKSDTSIQVNAVFMQKPVDISDRLNDLHDIQSLSK